MTKNNPPPFYDSPDGSLHCLQATLKSALEVFYPHIRMEFSELDTLTGYLPGKLTWPMAAYLGVAELGYTVRVIDPTDFNLFVKNPKEYLISSVGEEAADQIKRDSDLEVAVNDAIRLVGSNVVALETKIPEYEDLISLIDKGFLCICHVNQHLIEGKDGYIGHSILVYSANDVEILAHNPGPPAEENQKLARDFFCQAWGSPTEEAKTIFAIAEGKR